MQEEANAVYDIMYRLRDCVNGDIGLALHLVDRLRVRLLMHKVDSL